MLRQTTERPEAILSGVAVLVGTDAVRIRDAMEAALAESRQAVGSAIAKSSPFGDGFAATRIVDRLLGSRGR